MSVMRFFITAEQRRALPPARFSLDKTAAVWYNLFMEYKRFGKTIVARIDRGEEILAAVREIAEKENVALAKVSAIGAVNRFTAGVFDTETKRYHANEFEGSFEIVSLSGTIDRMNGEFYCHLHMSAGNGKGEVFGGHLNRALVSATCEMIIDIIDGATDRRYSEEIGLNLIDFGGKKC